MTFKEKLSECSRSKTVRILLLILLVALICVGVYFIARAFDTDETRDEYDTGSLEVIPNLDRGALISYKVGDRESVRSIVRKIEDTLKPYNVTSNNIYKGCNFFNHPPLGKTCDLDLKAFEPCVKERSYGFHKATPCIFLKLKRNPNWVPKFSNDSNLPEEMPADLKHDIKDYVKTSRKYAQIIWVSCEGKTPTDAENAGPINYFPRRGFPGFYFPCTSDVTCTEPLVAIFFERPKSQVTINVQCQIWAENLHQKVDVELLIE